MTERLILAELESTNSYLMQLAADQGDSLPNFYSVLAVAQVAGRGQRGNHWHSTAGRNLTFSCLVRLSGLTPSRVYMLSEFIAVGLLQTLESYLDEEQAKQLAIKWPNDLYYQDKKLAGILIENSITGGQIDYSILGVGLNLNEDSFPPELPNPIALRTITQEYYDLLEVHERLMTTLKGLPLGNYATIHQLYLQRLYRREGWHAYRDQEGQFKAKIREVLPSGNIVLEREDGRLSVYAFKEVIFDAD